MLVLEPALPGGALKTARKGCGEFELTVHGVAAHAGLDPGKGASAIHELAATDCRHRALQDLPRGISVNVGLVSGGSRPNVVAEEARATIDVRAPTREAADGASSGVPRAAPGQARHASNDQRRIRPAADGADGRRRPTVRARLAGGRRPSGASSAKVRPAAGPTGISRRRSAFRHSTVSVPIGDGAHAAHEHVDVTALPWRAALLAGLLAGLRGRTTMQNG